MRVLSALLFLVFNFPLAQASTLPENADVIFIDFETKDCDTPLKARFYVNSQLYVMQDGRPCGNIDGSGSIGHLINSIKRSATRNGLWKAPNEHTHDYEVVEFQGNCSDGRYEIYDPFLKKTYDILLSDENCDPTDRFSPLSGNEAVVQFIESKGLLLSRGETSFEKRRCDYNVNSENYLEVLEEIPLNAQHWRTVCFAGGEDELYTMPIRLNGYNGLILKGAGPMKLKSKPVCNLGETYLKSPKV